MTIRAVVLIVALGGLLYFARPHLPPWASQPLEGWIRSLHLPGEPRPSAR